MYEIFEQLLQKYGVTAYKVAKETGVTQTTLSNWKSGRSIPKQPSMQKIADFFGVSLDYLMTGKEPEDKQSDFEAKNKTERDLLVLCRSMDDVTEEEKEALVNNFRNSIDIFLKAKGLK